MQLTLDNPDLNFIVPEAGGTTFVDSMVIPITTRNQAGAEEWMNYVYDRDNYAGVSLVLLGASVLWQRRRLARRPPSPAHPRRSP